MAYPYTETGYNMFDMLSMIQKAIRRGDYEHAGFAAEQLKNRYRTTMWNRLLVITAEDCYGVLTKEIFHLRKQDDGFKDDQNIANAVALMCKALKSRDACYFSCNFVAASRNPRLIQITTTEVNEIYGRIKAGGKQYDSYGFPQFSMLDEEKPEYNTCIPEGQYDMALAGATLEKAIKHRDMDMMGYEMDMLRRMDRGFLWDVLQDYAIVHACQLEEEISALRKTDSIVNARRKDLEKDEIFISKAAMLLCYAEDPAFETVLSSDLIDYDRVVDWRKYPVKPINECSLRWGKIPDWTYDCHTLKGKRMGKTDWDMTTSEQAALTPLQKDYFSNASWLYTYEQDVEFGRLDEEGMRPIREFAKTHPVNPVEFIPYD